MNSNYSEGVDYYLSPYTKYEEACVAGILIVIIILSLYGNMGLLRVLYINDLMWNSTNFLIGNLLFTGICIAMISIPFNLIVIIYGRWPYSNGPICKLNAFSNSVLLLTEILTHTMLSIDKYCGVMKPFSRVLTPSRSLKLLMCVWFVAVFISIGPLLNFGNFHYNLSTLVCGAGFPRNKTDSLYFFLLALIGFLTPCSIMIFVYIKIFVAIKYHSRRLRSHSSVIEDVLDLQKRLILTSFYSFLCFLISWTPFCIFVVMATAVDTPHDLPHGLGVAAYICGYSYNVTNPMIICKMSSRFSNGLLNISKGIFPIHLCCYNTTATSLVDKTPSNRTPVLLKQFTEDEFNPLKKVKHVSSI